MSTINCNQLKEAINSICPEGDDKQFQIITTNDQSKYIVVPAEADDNLEALASKLNIGSSNIEQSDPTVTVLKSSDAIRQAFELKGIEDCEDKLKEFGLGELLSEDKNKDSDVTVQIAISSNYDEFVNVITHRIHEYGVTEDNITNLINICQNIINGGSEYYKDQLLSQFLDTEIKDAESKGQSIEIKGENLNMSLMEDSRDHKNFDENLVKFSIKTAIIEAKMKCILIALKKYLLISYGDFEKDGVFEIKEGEKNADFIHKKLNDKLDAFFGLEIFKGKVNQPLKIPVDDKYAPNRDESNAGFSYWEINENTKVFDLISIIKSMSVYLRMLL